ncbi:hypothetical protein Tco_0448786 [Tanacetum coccineum]
MNRLNVKTLTPELLAGPTFELMKGTCKSLTELEYFCEEVYKATTEKLDWINPEGRQYPHDLRQPLPLGNGRQISTLKNVLHICLLKNVHQKCCHQRRVEILTIGVMKALKETQPHKSLTRTISNLEYEKPYTPYSDPRRIHSMKQRQEEQ